MYLLYVRSFTPHAVCHDRYNAYIYVWPIGLCFLFTGGRVPGFSHLIVDIWPWAILPGRLRLPYFAPQVDCRHRAVSNWQISCGHDISGGGAMTFLYFRYLFLSCECPLSARRDGGFTINLCRGSLTSADSDIEAQACVRIFIYPHEIRRMPSQLLYKPILLICHMSGRPVNSDARSPALVRHLTLSMPAISLLPCM